MQASSLMGGTGSMGGLSLFLSLSASAGIMPHTSNTIARAGSGTRLSGWANQIHSVWGTLSWVGLGWVERGQQSTSAVHTRSTMQVVAVL